MKNAVDPLPLPTEDLPACVLTRFAPMGDDWNQAVRRKYILAPGIGPDFGEARKHRLSL